jgi:hypothetical protein
MLMPIQRNVSAEPIFAFPCELACLALLIYGVSRTHTPQREFLFWLGKHSKLVLVLQATGVRLSGVVEVKAGLLQRVNLLVFLFGIGNKDLLFGMADMLS